MTFLTAFYVTENRRTACTCLVFNKSTQFLTSIHDVTSLSSHFVNTQYFDQTSHDISIHKVYLTQFSFKKVVKGDNSFSKTDFGE